MVSVKNFLDEVRDDLKQMIIDNYPTRKALEDIEEVIQEIKEENGWDETLVLEGAQVADAINVAKGIIKGGKVAVDIDFYETGKLAVGEAETMNTEKKKDKKSIISTSTLYEEDMELPIDDIIEAIKTELERNCEWATIE